MPGPHGFAVRTCIGRPRAVIAHEVHLALRLHLRARRCRVHRIPSRVRDDRETPLCRDGMAGYIFLIWGGRQAGWGKRLVTTLRDLETGGQRERLKGGQVVRIIGDDSGQYTSLTPA